MPTCDDDNLKTTENGYTITWSDGDDDYVFSRVINGTFNDGSVKTIKAVCSIEEKNSITDADMVWSYYVVE